MYDVVIVGGGPAGLSAATILGRCRRTVLLCDDGKYRNETSRALHGYLSRDGIHPAELRRIGREQLNRYQIDWRNIRVTSARCSNAGFEIELENGERVASRTLLLATGVVDTLPEIDGIRSFYGNGVFHCPYCDGWENRERLLGAWGSGKNAAGLALSLKTWSPNVSLLTDGLPHLKAEEEQMLSRNAIRVYSERIARLEGGANGLEQVVFASGAIMPVQALFLNSGQKQRCDLAKSLGCAFTKTGAVRTGKLEGTNVPGLFVAGDASKDVQLAIVAAAEGAKAGVAINKSLEQADAT
jgi:thioredoxin reductase